MASYTETFGDGSQVHSTLLTNMDSGKLRACGRLLLWCVLVCGCLQGAAALGAGSVCARVEIEIEQEMTLEREGFEARLGVTNGLPTAMDNLRVTLNFTDAAGQPVAVTTDPAATGQEKFFYRVQTGYTMPGSVAAGTAAKVAFLIVPTIQATGEEPAGTLYYVGATVKYAVAGEEQVAEIAPDYILVKPMPALELQYFLPGDVYGDDPMTEEVVEPIVPFPLGVRVINRSTLATARGVAIQSSQPQILPDGNKLGLLIDFRIIGSEVNGAAAAPTLLSSFGDIAPLHSAVGSWLMSASLSGKFVKFSAEVSHAPEFGGGLTSLIQEPADGVTCRRLLGRVFVDLPGRDQLPDFLACTEMTGVVTGLNVFLYESDTAIPEVKVDSYTEESAQVSLAPSDEGNTLFATVDSTLLYIKYRLPFATDQIVHAVRSDGKVLPAANCWISKTKDSNLAWIYSLNLFDTDKRQNQSYALTYSNAPQPNRAPSLKVVGGRTFHVAPGATVYIDVSAQDPDGTIPTLSTGMLPEGAQFTDNKNGRGYFAWTPAVGREGTYSIQFKASDGALSDMKSASVVVNAAAGVGFDGWSKQYWPGVDDLAIIGANADPDGDGILNLMEYALGSDPTYPDQSLLPSLGIETIGGERFLSLTYWRRVAATDLEYKVLASETLFAPLSSWQQQTQTEVIDEPTTPHGYECVKVRDAVSMEASPGHRYLRLWIELKSTGGTP